MSFVNNPKYQPYLIALVVLLWILIAWRMYSYLEPEQSTEAIDIIHRMELSDQADSTWSPAFDYQDPFLKNTKITKVKKDQKKAAPIQKEVQIAELSAQVLYKGFIANNRSEERLGLFQVHGQTVLMKKGDYYTTILIKDMNDRHAVLSENGQDFIIELIP